MTELRKIPNVGPRTEADLLAMGYTTIESLKGKTAEELYAEECRLRGCQIDRCQLYLYRAVVYFGESRSGEVQVVALEGSACGGSRPRAQIDRLGRCTPLPRVPSAKCGGTIN